MDSTLIETLGEEIDRIWSLYQSSFAGQSRATRDTAEIDQLIQRTQAVLSKLEQVPSGTREEDLARLREVATENLRIYAAEKVAISEAKAAGPKFIEFSRLATMANFVVTRYARHYAGKDRGTRDLGLLADMIEDLKSLRPRMSAIAAKTNNSAFRRDLEIVEQSIAMYQSEIKEIEKTQASGSPDDQASIMATVANGQFRIYQAHFANHDRVSRRPALLQRVIDNLQRVKAKMKALKDAELTTDYNDSNIDIVERNLKLYETELNEIRKARQDTPIADIMGTLGEAANRQFELYRREFSGKERAAVDLQLLGDICDRLGEIARQMDDLSRAESNDSNERNLEVVISQLKSFEREFTEVARTQQAVEPPTG